MNIWGWNTHTTAATAAISLLLLSGCGTPSNSVEAEPTPAVAETTTTASETTESTPSTTPEESPSATSEDSASDVADSPSAGPEASASPSSAGESTAEPTTESAAVATPPAPSEGASDSGAAGTAGGALSVDTCAASMLSGELRTEPGSGAAGSVYRTLVLTNDSAEACSMFGFPGVSYRDAAGEQVGAPADREGGVSASEVVLQPGSSAFTVLQQTNAGNYGDDCLITDTVGLRVYPPNATDWLLVNQDSTACATPEIALLTVGVFEEA